MSLLEQRFTVKQLATIMEHIPSCIFFKDTDLKYVFSTHYWNQISGAGEDGFDIYGKTDLDIRLDKENAFYAFEQDKKILKTKKGCHYTIKSDLPSGIQYLEIMKEPVIDENGVVIGIVGLINDITGKKLLEAQANELMTRDMLTKAYNRHTGAEIIQQLLDKQEAVNAFCLLDIDKFKSINDVYGHIAGDEILKQLAKVVTSNIHVGKDVFMRLGGDEFIICLENIQTENNLRIVLNHIFDDLLRTEMLPDHPDIRISISVGAVILKKTAKFDDLYMQADKLMYSAKIVRGSSFKLLNLAP